MRKSLMWQLGAMIICALQDRSPLLKRMAMLMDTPCRAIPMACHTASMAMARAILICRVDLRVEAAVASIGRGANEAVLASHSG